MSGKNTKKRNLKAMSLLDWEAIKLAGRMNKKQIQRSIKSTTWYIKLIFIGVFIKRRLYG